MQFTLAELQYIPTLLLSWFSSVSDYIISILWVEFCRQPLCMLNLPLSLPEKMAILKWVWNRLSWTMHYAQSCCFVTPVRDFVTQIAWDSCHWLLSVLHQCCYDLRTHRHHSGWLPSNQHCHRGVLQCSRRSFWARFSENCPSLFHRAGIVI